MASTLLLGERGIGKTYTLINIVDAINSENIRVFAVYQDYSGLNTNIGG